MVVEPPLHRVQTRIDIMTLLWASLGILSTFFLPGSAVSYCFPNIRSKGRFALYSLALSICVFGLLYWFYILQLVSMTTVTRILIALSIIGTVCVGHAFLTGYRRRLSELDFWSLSLCGLMTLLILSVLSQKAILTGDFSFHLGSIRKYYSTEFYNPEMMAGRIASRGLEGYAFPVLDFAIALGSRISTLDPITFSYYLAPAFLLFGCIAWYHVGAAFNTSRTFCLLTVAGFFITYAVYTSFDKPLIYYAPQSEVFSIVVLAPLILSLLLNLLHGTTANDLLDRFVIVLLLVIIIFVHAIEWFNLVATTLTYGLLLVALPGNKSMRRLLLWRYSQIVMGFCVSALVFISVTSGDMNVIAHATVYDHTLKALHESRLDNGEYRLIEVSPGSYIAGTYRLFMEKHILSFLLVFFLICRNSISLPLIFLGASVSLVPLLSFIPPIFELLGSIVRPQTLMRTTEMAPAPLVYALLFSSFQETGTGTTRKYVTLGGVACLFVLFGGVYAGSEYAPRLFTLIRSWFMPLAVIVFAIVFWVRFGWWWFKNGRIDIAKNESSRAGVRILVIILIPIVLKHFQVGRET